MSRPKLAAALLLTLAGAAGPAATSPCEDGYRVVRGDTLYRIARRCGSSVAAIARASGVRNPNLIRVGQRLVIPGASRTAVARREAPPVRAEAPRAGAGPGVYRMARGDTLYSLARWSRTSLPALLAVNLGIDPHKIEIGDAVRLPSGAVAPERLRARERGVATAPPRAAPAAPAAQEPRPRREPADKPPPREADDRPPTREAEPEAM